MGIGKSALSKPRLPRRETSGPPALCSRASQVRWAAKEPVSGPGRRGHNKTQVRLAGQSLLRHIPPNYSLKRTVQSLRDWSCRLAHALGGWQAHGFAHGPAFQTTFAGASVLDGRVPYQFASSSRMSCSYRRPHAHPWLFLGLLGGTVRCRHLCRLCRIPQEAEN